ncbi:MAG: phosphopantetheine-binding protein, partial [Blastocatellia bacterium]
FMDSFVEHANRVEGSSWISANWDGWLFDDEQKLKRSVQTSIDQFAMLPAESLAAFDLVSAAMPPGQVVVSTGSLEDRLRLWIRPPEPGDVKPGDGEGATRPSRSRSGLTAAFIPAKGELEEGIANIWQDLLGVEAVGAQDNFFDLGGNSLIGLRVISRLKKDLGVEVPVVALFEGPTVGALAKLITRSSGSGDAVDQPGPGNRDRGERRRERLARVRA